MRDPVLDVEQLLAVVVVVEPVGAGKKGQVLDLVLPRGACLFGLYLLYIRYNRHSIQIFTVLGRLFAFS